MPREYHLQLEDGVAGALGRPLLVRARSVAQGTGVPCWSIELEAARQTSAVIAPWRVVTDGAPCTEVIDRVAARLNARSVAGTAPWRGMRAGGPG